MSACIFIENIICLEHNFFLVPVVRRFWKSCHTMVDWGLSFQRCLSAFLLVTLKNVMWLIQCILTSAHLFSAEWTSSSDLLYKMWVVRLLHWHLGLPACRHKEFILFFMDSTSILKKLPCFTDKCFNFMKFKANLLEISFSLLFFCFLGALAHTSHQEEWWWRDTDGDEMSLLPFLDTRHAWHCACQVGNCYLTREPTIGFSHLENSSEIFL